MRLYHHRTDGGAEYLTDRYVECQNGDKEGVFEDATIIVRIDGDITKDAEVSLGGPLAAAPRLIAAAPDLLQACKMALEWAAEYPKYREWAFVLKARGAIAAIEGKE